MMPGHSNLTQAVARPAVCSGRELRYQDNRIYLNINITSNQQFLYLNNKHLPVIIISAENCMIFLEYGTEGNQCSRNLLIYPINNHRKNCLT
jgi:hypothetical protein